MKFFLLVGPVLALLTQAPGRAETYAYWVQPCTVKVAQESKCQAVDTELAEWALQAWQQAAGSGLTFVKAPEENKARLRIYWASGASGLYGEAVPILVDGQRGAAVHVLPDIAELGRDIADAGGKDVLFRHAIVYLTCLHESGHAIGLNHTRDYNDIMYAFGYGGDIVEYFARYRRKLASREDIRNNPGMSAADRARLRGLYGAR